VLKEHQIIDGCCSEGDFVNFRVPLRGVHARYLTPTAKNVFNKFSVRFFVRLSIHITPKPRAQKPRHDSDSENGEEKSEETEKEEDEIINSNFLEVVLWR